MGYHKYVEALKTVSPATFLALGESDSPISDTYRYFFDHSTDSKILDALSEVGHPMSFFRNDVKSYGGSIDLLELLNVLRDDEEYSEGYEFFEESIWPQMHFSGVARIIYDNSDTDWRPLGLTRTFKDKVATSSKIDTPDWQIWGEECSWISLDNDKFDVELAIQLTVGWIRLFGEFEGNHEELTIDQLTGMAILDQLSGEVGQLSNSSESSLVLNPAGESLVISIAEDFVHDSDRPWLVVSNYPHQKSIFDWAGMTGKERNTVINQMIIDKDHEKHGKYISTILSFLMINTLTTPKERVAIEAALRKR
jgi:hypothetical protein